MKRTPITMPVLSDTMETGHLVSWQKKVGDPVKKGEVIAEIESDKAIMDLEAFEDGYLAGPLAPEDSDIPVGATIGYLVDSPEAAQQAGDKKEEKPAPEPSTPKNTEEKATVDAGVTMNDGATPPSETKASSETPPSQPASQHYTETSASTGTVKASPYARGLAQELGVDLAAIAAGSHRVISSKEVLAAALKQAISEPVPNLDAGPPYHYKLLSSMRRSVAENMIATLHTPTFRVAAVLHVEPLQQAAHNQKISLTLALARAAALTVTEHPNFNMCWTPSAMAVREQVDVGIAVDIPGGLVTPVIRDAAQRRIKELQEDWRILKNKTKRQRLTAEDYQGATFYISNLGTFPVVQQFDAIVPLGAAAILAIGASHDGKATMTLSCDHRVVYGADAARFLATLESYLSDPEAWLNETQ